ncbi:beta strand repeat-containing protein [Glaciimonas soli]|uniref:DUF11 domain-containing protein n=1 Tax=Glaciimonas soli TaxID=2590999 RepID=A0A843YUN0_9BURK|nr:DUF11 domain-containing protein [Glaciimonas soli]MQR01208.1 DUF11 domain-containing protein [Glaciimonas soli]
MKTNPDTSRSFSANMAFWRPSVAKAKRILRVAAIASLATLTFALPNLAHATPPAAGTSIGNQASASYTDGSGTTRTVTSNTVQTIVQQVASLTLTANGAKTSAPGSTVYYPQTLTNTGNGSDTFNLNYVNSGAVTLANVQFFADNGSGQPTGAALTSTGVLAAGAAFKFVVAGTVPASATTGTTNTLTVSGTSSFNASITASVTDVTTVSINAVINVTKSVSAASGAAGSGPYTYTLSYTNTGNNTATAVKLIDAIPTGMTYVAGSGLWSVTGATVLTDATGDLQGTSPNTIDYSVTGTTITAILAQVAPGQSGTLTFKVTVGASTGPGVINNTATVSYNDGSGTTITGGTNTVPFTVAQVGGVTLTPPAAVASANPGATISFTNVIKNTGTGTDTFNITFANPTTGGFPTGTTFQLFKSDGVTPLVDTNGDGVPDTGPLAAGATYNVILKATLPTNASGAGPFAVNKTATSVFDATKSNTGADTLTAIAAVTVDVTNNAAIGGTGVLGVGQGPEASAVVTNTVNPGTTSSFTLYANNTSGIADTYNLVASTSSTYGSSSLPTGWTVTFTAGSCSTTGTTITNTGVVVSGANFAYCAVVTIPATGAGAAAGKNDLYFSVVSPSTGAKDVIHDNVTINAVRSLTFTPNNSAQAYPGGSVVYSHTLTNTGNVTEGNGTASTIVLASANNQTNWTSVQYYDVNGTGVVAANDPVVPASGINSIAALAAGLAPGQSIKILEVVYAPSGAAPGSINATTVTVTTNNGTYTTTVPAVATATDSTSVIAGNVTIVKQQALDAACTSPAMTYSAATLATGAVPGACIGYQITVTNIGSAAATSVVVSDSTPAYTTYQGGAATTVGTVTAPTVGSAGTVTATIGTLIPGAAAVVTFEVKIGQ